MSRGPGIWQRRIPNRVADGNAFYLTELLPPRFTAAEYQAAWRAAQTLNAKQVVGISRSICGREKMLVHPPGVRPDRLAYAQSRWRARAGLSVESVTGGDPFNTYDPRISAAVSALTRTIVDLNKELQ